jgi:hypothetical protein
MNPLTELRNKADMRGAIAAVHRTSAEGCDKRGGMKLQPLVRDAGSGNRGCNNLPWRAIIAARGGM